MRRAALSLLLLTACAPNVVVEDAGPATTPAPINLEPAPSTTADASTTPSTSAPTPPTTDGDTTGDPDAEVTTTSTSTKTTTETTTKTTTTTSTTTTTTTLPPDPLPPNSVFDGLALGLELVADVDKPTAVVWHDGAMYVSTQPGPVYRVDVGAGGDTVVETVIDLTDQTFEALPGSERGVLGVAVDPRDGRMFVNLTDLDHNTRVVSYELVDGVADPASRREVLFVEQPGVGHNGGRLLFDADGNLYIGSGDGGASNGWDAQDTSKLLGAILRVTPRLDGDGYTIPPDNPYADGVTDRPEVLARGFRNPWTFTLDDDTGDIWIGDVGNNTIEEISRLRPDQWGANFGWPYFEGNDRRRREVPVEVVEPVFAYPRSRGVAVMAGHVYRGAAIPPLRGAYLFGDLTGPVWAIGIDGVTRLDVDRVNTLVGWGEDPDGEVYLLSLRDGVYRLVERADG